MLKYIKKFFSLYVVGNIYAMILVVALLAIGVKYALDNYTNHGKTVVVPDIVKMDYDEAKKKLDAMGLELSASDTVYIKSLKPNIIVEQVLKAGVRVKMGRMIYVTINASHAKMVSLPDLVDNSSLREAQNHLTSMGLSLTEPEYINGEKEWVYGILVNGRRVVAGERISVEDSVTIQVGNGHFDPNDSSIYKEEAVYVNELVDANPDEQMYQRRRQSANRPKEKGSSENKSGESSKSTESKASAESKPADKPSAE
ncbi:MAG: PASTA domain-containing protein [Prevotella sp.]|nr:PASTA domain-containing protein [Prevotella sp.]